LYIDPVGDASAYSALPRPNIILVTHEHGDHFSTSTLEALVGSSTILITNPSVADKLPENLKQNLVVMKNGDTHTIGPLTIEAVPAYNTRPEAQNFHPQGRGNGYVLESHGTRVYIAGDTEGTPEMRALKDIDIAFVPMNLPYTMSVEDAAQAVLAFKPKQVYPYHYDGQAGLSDIEQFKSLVQASDPNIQVLLSNWYPNQ
jgi:L-ascorbate metabolism protein UlaG (beta-lactamase superfamily)